MILRHVRVFDSSTISAVLYVESASTLVCWFKSSPLPYLYSPCPVDVFKAIITAESAGSAVSSLLKKSLTITCRQLTEPEYDNFKRTMADKLK